MTTITQSISALPTAPARTQADATFAANLDAFVRALSTLRTEVNTWAGQVNTVTGEASTNATNAAASATAAAASAAAAVASSGASVWVSGTTYAIGNVRYSPVTLIAYRRKTNGAGTTDPSADPTNWVSIISPVYSASTATVVSGAVATVDFTGITGTDWLLDIAGITVSGTGVSLQIQTSTNGGSSWSSATALSSNTLTTGTAYAARAECLGISTGAAFVIGGLAQTPPTTATTLILPPSGVINAVRIKASSGNITAGTLTPYTR